MINYSYDQYSTYSHDHVIHVVFMRKDYVCNINIIASEISTKSINIYVNISRSTSSIYLYVYNHFMERRMHTVSLAAKTKTKN